MPRRALRCLVDINIHAITCPGVWLPRRDDVYLNISLFNQLRRTQLTTPAFPILFHEKFKFDKVFHYAFEPAQVADSLSEMEILIELIQESDMYEGGKLLAYYRGNARNFLYPYPSYSPSYGPQDREILMERSLDFPKSLGISPKLEFSTKTVIKETAAPLLDSNCAYESDVPLYSARGCNVAGRESRRRSRSRSRGRRSTKRSSVSRPTIASIYRCRSVSPSVARRLEALDLDDYCGVSDDDKPPFVVRKVDSHQLIGRTPGTVKPRRGRKGHRSISPRRPVTTQSGYSSFYDEYLSDQGSRPWGRIRTVVRENGEEPYPMYRLRGSGRYAEPDSDDSEVMALTGVNGTYRRSFSPYHHTHNSAAYRSTSPAAYRSTSPGLYRSTSPAAYRTSLRDRFDERPWSPTRSALISGRVDNALKRNRSLERLDRLHYPYSYSTYY